MEQLVKMGTDSIIWGPAGFVAKNMKIKENFCKTAFFG